MPTLFLLLVGVLAADQLTKTIVRSQMRLGSEIPVLPFFSITHVDNTGIAFGMFQEKNLAFIGLGIVVTAFLIFYAIHLLKSDRPTALAMGAIVGGAIGNLIDRIWFGRVTDFLDVFIGVHHWPVFNIADSAICVGAGFIVLHGLMDWKNGVRR